MLDYVILVFSVLIDIVESHLKNNPHKHNSTWLWHWWWINNNYNNDDDDNDRRTFYNNNDDDDDRRTFSPSFSPSLYPSFSPSLSPTFSSSLSPTFSPSLYPTFSPSLSPTFSPSLYPTFSPSLYPTFSPSLSASLSPSLYPSSFPSMSPILARSLSSDERLGEGNIFIIAPIVFVCVLLTGTMFYKKYRNKSNDRKTVVNSNDIISFENNISEGINSDTVYLEPTAMSNFEKYDDVYFIDDDGTEHTYDQAVEMGLTEKNNLYDDLDDNNFEDVQLYDKAIDN